VPLVPVADPAEVAPPAVVPPAVEPAVDPLRDPDELPMLAFVRMNDGAFPLPDVERDALAPAVEVPAVDPDVPVAPAVSPCCKQPVTVIVPLCCDPDGWLLLLCAATIAVHPKPIANIHAARFIDASCSYRVRHVRLQASRHHAPARAVEASQGV
jgi:hypothetical protein